MLHRISSGAAVLESWFTSKGWQLYPHQEAMITMAERGRSTLLIAPTGGGKTMAGFLPSLIELADGQQPAIHTIYISPLKALTQDVARNLLAPIGELELPIRLEMRTGDTSSSRKKRQFAKPPHILLTTPESLELLLSYADAKEVLGNLKRIVIDEIHALAAGKRGHLTALCVSRLKSLNPQLSVTGLSATVANPEALAAWIGDATIIRAADDKKPSIRLLQSEARIPWGGYMATYAVNDIYRAIKGARTSIVFVNTRAQAEWLFQQLWRANEDNLPIGLHHGSLERLHRQKVEDLMAKGGMRAIVATASLDLGLDWGAVDLVIQVGAPKGISRLLQRIGRSNHRYEEPSQALLVPTNRFETLECAAVMQAIEEGVLDAEFLHRGSLDVLAQFVMNTACAGPFHEKDLFNQIISAPAYAHLSMEDFEQTLASVAHGGYALKAYERFQRIEKDQDGFWRATKTAVRRHRMNAGAIVENETLPVGLKRRNSPHFQTLGRIEDFFVQGLSIGDTFIFAGQLLRFLGVRDDKVMVEKGQGGKPKIPSFIGGRLPLSAALADRVLAMLQHHDQWGALPKLTQNWLLAQQEASELPQKDTLLVESFPHQKLCYTVLYSFAGRNANQTLGFLLSQAMEHGGSAPLGFVASDYALALWSLRPVADVKKLIEDAFLGSSLDAWIAKSQMAKRAFREVAIIAGLVERNAPGKRKSGRQVTIATDLIYEVLMRHEKDHILLRATREDVETKLSDIPRLKEHLAPLHLRQRDLKRPSPLSIPLLLDIGVERVKGKARKELLSHHQLEALREADGDRLFNQAGTRP